MVCNHYLATKGDYLYRGDVVEDIPFLAFDGGPIPLQNDDPNRKGRDFIPSYEVKNFRSYKQYNAIANVEFRRGIILSRTCETAKTGGQRKVFPAAHAAPIRPLSDFKTPDDPIGIDYATRILNGSIGDDGQREEGYRFAYMHPCEQHGLEAGLICFREMQPINGLYLARAEKKVRLATTDVHTVVERLQRCFDQTAEDDEKDAEPATEKGEQLQRWERDAAKHAWSSEEAAQKMLPRRTD